MAITFALASAGSFGTAESRAGAASSLRLVKYSPSTRATDREVFSRAIVPSGLMQFKPMTAKNKLANAPPANRSDRRRRVVPQNHANTSPSQNRTAMA